MSTTKGQMIERIRRILSGGFPSTRDRIRDAEIEKHMESAMNRLLKAEMFNVTYNMDGDSIPQGVMIATYTNLPASGIVNDPSYTVKIPVTPQYLPDGMGVFKVIVKNSLPSAELIPIPPGQYGILNGSGESSSLISQRIGYTWEGPNVRVWQTATLTTLAQLFEMQLCVVSLNSLSSTSVLPLTPDLEEAVIDAVVKAYVNEVRTIRDESFQGSPENFIK
jgi:hypothetical protein